jgi:hypothetical protein
VSSSDSGSSDLISFGGSAGAGGSADEEAGGHCGGSVFAVLPVEAWFKDAAIGMPDEPGEVSELG